MKFADHNRMQGLRGLTLSKINEITVRINASSDLQALLTSIMDVARDLLRSEAASLLLYDAETEELIFDIARGPSGRLLAQRRIPAGQGIAGACAAERKPIIVNDAASDQRLLRSIDADTGFQTRNLLAVPMMAGAELIGVLEALNASDGRAYDSSDVRLLTYLSNMAALAIRNRRLYDDLQERMDELNCIYEISQSVRDKETVDELLDSVLEAVSRVLGVERLSVMLLDEQGLRLARTLGFAVGDQDLRIDPESGVAGIVLRTGDPLLVRDLEKDLRMAPHQASRYSTRSFVAVPIVVDGKPAGVLNAADKRSGQAFDYFEMKVLSTVANQIADASSRIRSRQREIEIQLYRKDLDTAAMIQKNSLPRIPGRIAGLEVATRYEACREVGGDFYDLIYHSENRISLVMADVAGKGVPAALFMEYSKTLLSGQIPRNLDPVTSLMRVNQELSRQRGIELFVTCMLIQVEREFARLRLASAGHNRQILFRRRSNELELLSGKGAPLGAFPGTEYMERIYEYEPGDLLVLYTDGVTEATNRFFQEFGDDRLFALIREHSTRSPEEVIRLVFEDVTRFREGFEASDDATMMVVRL